MLFHRRVFLRAMRVLIAVPIFRAAGWNLTKHASNERKGFEMEIKESWHATFGQGAVRLVYRFGTNRHVVSGA